MKKHPTPYFREELRKCLAFFKFENLRSTPVKLGDDVALLVIDVQKEFCDPASVRGNKETDKVARKIKSLVPKFRKAGIPVYVVYYSSDGEIKPDKMKFYRFKPSSKDRLVAKDANSAFTGSDLESILRADHRTKLLTCGFNLSACIKETVEDGLARNFDVCVMQDLTGNDNYCQEVSREETLSRLWGDGATIASSEAVLHSLRHKKKARRQAL